MSEFDAESEPEISARGKEISDKIESQRERLERLRKQTESGFNVKSLFMSFLALLTLGVVLYTTILADIDFGTEADTGDIVTDVVVPQIDDMTEVVPSDEVPVDEVPTGEVPTGEVPSEEAIADKAKVGDESLSADSMVDDKALNPSEDPSQAKEQPPTPSVDVTPKRRTRKAKPKPAKPRVQLGGTAFRKELKKKLRSISICKSRVQKNDPNFSGRWEVKYTLHTDGKTTAVRVIPRTRSHSEFEACVKTKIKKWKFSPQPKKKTMIHPIVI